MDKAPLLIYVALFTLLVFSQCANIDQTLGANPVFFNLTEQSNLEILNNSNLTSDEKFYLLFHNNLGDASLLSNIESYNLMMNFPCAPYDTKIYNKNYIRDAWVKVITVLPSIHEFNKTWSLPVGEVITAFDYNITIPRSATNIYPDCGPTYSMISTYYDIFTYANRAYIGGVGVSKYNLTRFSENLTVEATLNISLKIIKNLYGISCYCCKVNNKNICIEVCCTCKYSNAIYEEEKISINDSLERSIYDFSASPKLTMLQCPVDILNTATGNFTLNTTNNYESFSMKFKDAYLNITKNKLDIYVTTLPYKVLELEIISAKNKFTEGIYIPEVVYSQNLTSFNFTGLFYNEVTNASSADAYVNDLFGVVHDLKNETSIYCPSNTQIKIFSKNFLREEEKFYVEVELSANDSLLANKEVRLLYGDLLKEAYTDIKGQANFELQADEKNTLIEAKFEYDGEYASAYARKTIFVYTNSTHQQFMNLIALTLLLFLTYIGLKFIIGGSL